MNGLSLALIGLWMIGTGWHDNASTGYAFIFKQKTFFPWLVAVLIIYALYQVPGLRTPIKAIVSLALVAIVLKQWPTIEQSYINFKQSAGVP